MSGVYFKYFNSQSNLIEETSLLETNNLNQIKKLENKISDLELKNKRLSSKIENNKMIINNEEIESSKKTNTEFNESSKKNTQKDIEVKRQLKKDENIEPNKNIVLKKDIKNLVKDVEYTSVDQKGNKFYLLATSGKSNIDNNDILDLDNVRGKITSDRRDTIYITSDFAKYNTVNLNSNFYENVIINYQDKQINCLNFDINMETNKAIAYNDVIVTDPKSVMKAGIIEFDLKTKNIIINPENINKDINVVTN